MKQLTRRLWEEQDRHPGDRLRLFESVADFIGDTPVLYPGSFVDIAASFVFDSVTYVDNDRRAARFFAYPGRRYHSVAHPIDLERLVAALSDLEARLRTPDGPDGVPFPFDPLLIESGNVWTLSTRSGDLDLVVSPNGTGGFKDLIRAADRLVVALDPELAVNVASLADVIRSKEAAGRDKDRAALPLLRRTLEELG